MRRAAVLAAVLGMLAAVTGSAALHAARTAVGSPVGASFGKLAYVWRGHLYILDASGRRQITFRGLVRDPAWSRDGQSLTYVLGPLSSAEQEWTVRADGSGAHRIPSRTCSDCRSPDGRRIVVVEQGAVPPPSGRSPAAVRLPSLAVANASTGRIIRRYRVPARRGDFVDFWGWWPDGRALLFQVDAYASASIAADGLELYSLTLSDGRLHPLAHAFRYPDWLTVHTDQLLVVAGGDRSIYFDKHVALCGESGGCRTVAGGARSIAVDPAWSPVGNQIAWVEAPAHPGMYGTGSDRDYRRWERTRTLWVAARNGTHAMPVDSLGGGIADPQWTRDGRGVLFVRDDAIWFHSRLGVGKSVMLARLFRSAQVPSYTERDWVGLAYYGHVQWESLFAWWRP
jgi:dipeptidyl aminopeptidase/acylaminoacyl peptidase